MHAAGETPAAIQTSLRFDADTFTASFDPQGASVFAYPHPKSR